MIYMRLFKVVILQLCIRSFHSLIDRSAHYNAVKPSFEFTSNINKRHRQLRLSILSNNKMSELVLKNQQEDSSSSNNYDTNNHNPHNFSWQQTMLRIRDPKVSVPFYVDNFGFQLIHKYDFPQWKFSLYFLAILPVDDVCPVPGTIESEQYLWTMKGTCLELTHNYGTEEDAGFIVSSGNVEPNRGFGHIALMTSDVYKVCEELEFEKNVKFQKRPDEGRMKGIAFALDPDGYWIEIVSRHPTSIVTNKYTFAQTMFRVKDAQKALFFYRDLLGMTLIRESHFSDFSLYFLAHIAKEEVDNNIPKDPTSIEASDYIRCMFGPVIELTHNHGTEADPTFKYYNGNDQDHDWQVRGFGHVGFLVDDLDVACAALEEKGVMFKKKPLEGAMRGLAFAYDPDNYWVEIIQRGGIRMLT